MKDYELYQARDKKSSQKWLTQGAAILSTVLAASSPVLPIIQMAGSVFADDTAQSTTNLALTKALQNENSLASKYALVATGSQSAATTGTTDATRRDLAAAEFMFSTNPAVTGISLVNNQLAVTVATGTPVATVLAVLNYIEASGYKAIVTASPVATTFTNNATQNGSPVRQSVPLTTPITELDLPAGLIEALLGSTTASGQTLAEQLHITSEADYSKVTLASLRSITELNLSDNTALKQWMGQNIGGATYNPGQKNGAELRNFQNLFGIMTGITTLNMSGLMAGASDMSVITAFMQAINLPKLTKLTTLDLSNNAGAIDVNSLNISSSSLTTLNLANNNISGLGPGSLSNLPNLLNLNLANNHINYLTSGVQSVFYQLDSLNLDNNPLNDNGMKWLQKIMTDNPDFVLTMNGGSASYQGDNGQAIAITGQTGADYVAQEAQSLQDEYTSLQSGVMNALASLADKAAELAKSDDPADQQLAQQYATDMIALQQVWQMLPNMTNLTNQVANFSTIFHAKSAMDLVRDKLKTALDTVTTDDKEAQENEAASSEAQQPGSEATNDAEMSAATEKGASIARDLSSLNSNLDLSSYESALSSVIAVASSAAKAASSIANADSQADYQADTAATASALADRGASSAASYLSNAKSDMALASSALSAGESYAAAGNVSSANDLFNSAESLYNSAANAIKSASATQSTADEQLRNASSAASLGSQMVDDANTVSFVNSIATVAQSSAAAASSLVSSAKSVLNDMTSLSSDYLGSLDAATASSLASIESRASKAISVAQSYTDQASSAADATKSLAAVTSNAGMSYIDNVFGNGNTLNTSSIASVARSQMTSAANGANSDAISTDSYYKQASSALVVASSQASLANSMKSSIINSILAAQSSSAATSNSENASDGNSLVTPPTESSSAVVDAPVSDSSATSESSATSDTQSENESSAVASDSVAASEGSSVASESSTSDDTNSSATVSDSTAASESSEAANSSVASDSNVVSDSSASDATSEASSAVSDSAESSVTSDSNATSESQGEANASVATSDSGVTGEVSSVASDSNAISESPAENGPSTDTTDNANTPNTGANDGTVAAVANPTATANTNTANATTSGAVAAFNAGQPVGTSGTTSAATTTSTLATGTASNVASDGTAGARVRDTVVNGDQITSAAQRQVADTNDTAWYSRLIASIVGVVMGFFFLLFSRRRKEREDESQVTDEDSQLFSDVEQLKSQWRDENKDNK